MRTAILLTGCLPLLLSAVVSAQDADFGDLPDGIAGGFFPTLRNSANAVAGRTGPYHINIHHEWISLVPFSTTVEPDALMVDMDYDDGIDAFYFANIFDETGFLRMGQVAVPITTDGDDAVRYLNIAADLNGDGRFQTYTTINGAQQWEWLACNVPIVHQNETKIIAARFYLDEVVHTVPCTRITLTTVPINPSIFGLNGWDGSGPTGGFERGETEDHCPALAPDEYHFSSGGVYMSPPFVPVAPYTEENPPTPPSPRYQRPRARKPLQWVQPVQPLGPLQPEVETRPPRSDQDIDEPIIRDADPAPRMPDIKQGEDECAPTATANSLRYLMDRNGTTPPDMNPNESDEFNRNLYENLKRDMKTNSPSKGTTIRPRAAEGENPEEEPCDYMAGKEKANEYEGIDGRLTTSPRPNPSFDEICDAVNAGKNVEIFWLSYQAGEQNPAQYEEGHMVTITGCVRHPDGTLELKFHDPNDQTREEDMYGPGDTAYPPVEHSIIVENGTGDSSKGGLRVKGVPDGYTKELVYKIAAAFIEEFSEPKDLGARAATIPSKPVDGHELRLEATADAKSDTYYYQWIRDGIDISNANDATLIIPSLGPLDYGVYQCWIYDGNGGYQYTPEISLPMQENGGMPVGGIIGVLFVALSTALLAIGVLQSRQKSGETPSEQRPIS